MKLTALLLLVSLGLTAAIDCRTNEIACSNGEKCIPQRYYICDYYNDCADASDEDEELCRAWNNDYCTTGFADCTLNRRTLCIEISEYCTSENLECEGSLDRRICLMLKGKKLDKLSNINVTLTTNGGDVNTNSCPPLYTLIGDQCLSVYSTGHMGWAEARAFCKVQGGDLWTFKNISQYVDTVQYLQKYELPSSYWIGGSVSNDAEGWTWIDGSPMQMGTPFWTTRYSADCVNWNVTKDIEDPPCIHYYQSPEGLPLGNCASLSHDHSFYIADEDCLRGFRPLCVYQGTDFPKRPQF